MTDREKVVVEIEDALSGNLAKAGHVYKLSLNGLKDKALTDALALLKEQEEEIQSLRRENHDILTQFHEWAKEQPQIVRCKDCKHWYFADNRIPSEQENVCGRNGIVITPDWFCADGERRTE